MQLARKTGPVFTSCLWRVFLNLDKNGMVRENQGQVTKKCRSVGSIIPQREEHVRANFSSSTLVWDFNVFYFPLSSRGSGVAQASAYTHTHTQLVGQVILRLFSFLGPGTVF